MATEALNIRIDSELKQKLDNESERTGLTKTKILEGILKDYFAGSDNQLPTSNNINVDNSDSENLEARIARIEDALFGNDKNIPDRAEKAFDNYAGLEDSLNDLWEEHSQQRQQIREMKDGFSGLTCEINPNQQQKLQNQLYETQCRLNQVEDSVASYGDFQKQCKEDIRELKNDIQSIKVNRVQRHEFYDLQEKVGSLENQDQSQDHTEATTSQDDQRDRLQNPEKEIAEYGHNESSEAKDEDGISYRRLAEKLEIDKSYLTKWQQGQVPGKKSKPKTKEAYEK